MKLAKSWRNRISPRNAFEEQQQEDTASFLNRVGVLFYGTAWSWTAIATLGERNASNMVGSDADLAVFVRDQVLTGLRSGQLNAIILLTAAAWGHARRDLPTDKAEELSDYDLEQSVEAATDYDDPLIGEDRTPKQRQFMVTEKFWSMAEADISVDWASSILTISAQHLRDYSSVSRSKLPIADNYDVPSDIRDAPLRILYPFRALRALVSYEELPDEAWLDRYKRYRDNGRMEALAAMWRYLAINGATSTDLSAAQLARRADEYLSAQGFRGSRGVHYARKRNSGLEEMASLVLSQWRESSMDSSVLVSSNPRKRRPA